MAEGPSQASGIAALQERIGHSFARRELLERALTHSSLAFEQGATDDAEDNEELEFLGDAVVGLIAADSLYRRYPELKEGELTRLRASLVSRQHLGRVAAKLELGTYLFLGKGEERSGGRKKAAILANSIEAVIGAMYLDGGLEAARSFVETWVVEPYVGELREAIKRGGAIGDHKSALQEYLQARKAGQPRYVVKDETGPDHRKRFLVEVHMPGGDSGPRVLARGAGTTKKHAEQEAARRGHQKLVRESEGQPNLTAAEEAQVEGTQNEEEPELIS
jgi:ribonuclease III